MPIKENITSFRSYLTFAYFNITGNLHATGAIFDTINCNGGIGFGLAVLNNSGTNTKFTMELYHGDHYDLDDEEIIPIQNHVYGSRSGLRPYAQGDMDPGHLNDRMKMTVEGVFSTKRYLRSDLVVTDWDGSGGCQAFMVAYLWPDLVPVPQRLGALSS